MRAIAAIADGLNAAELREALAQLEKTHLPDRDRVRDPLLARLAELDPVGAMQLAQAVSDVAERSSATRAVISAWAESDLPAAEKWVAAIPSGPVKTTALTALAETVAVTDPASALSFAQQIPYRSFMRTYGQDGPDLIHALFDKWIEEDPAAAAAAAARLPQSAQFRELALYLVAKSWAEADFNRAVKWAESLPGGNNEANDKALSGVLEVWMTKDAGAALDWLKQQPDGAAKKALLKTVFQSSEMFGLDPSRLIDLALLQPRGFPQERAVDAAAQAWTEKDPLATYQWAMRQTDDRVRANALKRVAAGWFSHDPSGASQWFNSLPASEDKSAMLENAVRLILSGEKWGNYGAMPLIRFMSVDAIHSFRNGSSKWRTR